jgi:hypothetical protein
VYARVTVASRVSSDAVARRRFEISSSGIIVF